MKRNFLMGILLVVIVLGLVSLACITGTIICGQCTPGSPAAQQTRKSAYDATATFGAEVIHIQLTAIAQPYP